MQASRRSFVRAGNRRGSARRLPGRLGILRAVGFQADEKQTVEVRTLYDPENLYFRWHARLLATFDPKPLQPVRRIFSQAAWRTP